jgi:spore coat protein U-like protein
MNMLMIIGRASAAVVVPAVLLAAGTPAFAATSTTNMNVSATVTANCTVSTSPVAFGSVNPISGANVDATGSVTVACTNGTGWSATANAGGGTGATLASRRMASGGNLLTYALYTDSGRTTVWGDGTASTAPVTGTGSGSDQTVTIYGRVPSGQTAVPPGSYTDTVSVTVTY